jgi:hypothetical protein
LAALTGLTGCAVSTHPLSDARNSDPDHRLLGRWEMADSHSELIYTLDVELRTEKSNVLVVKPISVRPSNQSQQSKLKANQEEQPKKDPPSSVPLLAGEVSEEKVISELVAAEIKELEGAGVVELYCTSVEGMRFLSLREIPNNESGEAPPSFLIFRYELDDDGIRLDRLDLDLIRALIQAEKLKGTLGTGRIIKSARITESPEGLRAFLAEQGNEIFTSGERIPLKRISVENEVSVGR